MNTQSKLELMGRVYFCWVSEEFLNPVKPTHIPANANTQVTWHTSFLTTAERGDGGEERKRHWRKRNTQKTRGRTKETRGTSVRLEPKCRCLTGNFPSRPQQQHVTHLTARIAKMTHGWLSDCHQKKGIDGAGHKTQKCPFIWWLKLYMLRVTVSAEWGLIFRKPCIRRHWLHRAAWIQPEVNCTSICHSSTCRQISS